MISCCCTNYPSSSPNHPLPSLPSLLLSVSEKDMVGCCMERKSQGGNRRPYSHSDMLWRLINCHIIIINPGSAGTMAVKPMCVCVCWPVQYQSHLSPTSHQLLTEVLHNLCFSSYHAAFAVIFHLTVSFLFRSPKWPKIYRLGCQTLLTHLHLSFSN